MSNSPLNIRNNPAVCWVTAQVPVFTGYIGQCVHTLYTRQPTRAGRLIDVRSGFETGTRD